MFKVILALCLLLGLSVFGIANDWHKTIGAFGDAYKPQAVKVVKVTEQTAKKVGKVVVEAMPRDSPAGK
jgi:hypothetical protein